MRAQILEPTQANIEKAARALLAGDVVGMPTETVYGLAGAAFQTQALGKIFESKERPSFDPLIVHVAPEGTPSLDALSELVDLGRLEARDQTEKLLATFWPGPFTLVLPKQGAVPDLATSGLPTVGVRMPAHPVAQALIRAAGTPLAAPSANRFGRISPTTAQAVDEELGDRIPFILDGGPCSVGVESTIVGYPVSGRWRLLRPGGVAAERIEEMLGEKLERAAGGSRPEAPGMLDSHYAPRKTLRLLAGAIPSLSDADLKSALQSKRPGVLLMSGDPAQTQTRIEQATGKPVLVVSLSRGGDLVEAAAGLFAGLRRLDRSDCDAIYAEPCPSQLGLGYAIADRLRRASAG